MGILNTTHESLVTDLPTTKRYASHFMNTRVATDGSGRDIFYQDVGLFGNQREVDQLTDDLAATFGLERSDLNVVSCLFMYTSSALTDALLQRASGKGLLCGDGLKIVLADESAISATNTDVRFTYLMGVIVFAYQGLACSYPSSGRYLTLRTQSSNCMGASGRERGIVQ